MLKNIDLDKIKKIHFIGIGGSGMGPLAQILHDKGYEVTGSDTYVSDTLEKIEKMGIKISLEHKASNVHTVDLVVYTAAISPDNPEILEAEKLGIPTIDRATMLGIMSSKYKTTIAVAGTHGKTSTTSMITHIMINAGKDPSAIIGGKLTSIDSNARIGHSDIMICEACEFVDSFLKLYPEISVILNIDKDHMDYFKNLDNIKKSFKKFVDQSSKIVLYNGDDSNVVSCVQNASHVKTVSFGLSSQNDYYATDLSDNDLHCKNFTLMNKDEKIASISLRIPGKYNVFNAVAAAATAHTLGVSASDIENSLNSFSGVHRRFEILANINGVTIADDFAHHPTELNSVLSCASQLGFNRVWALFQPHTFHRTAMFLDEFAKSLAIADKVVISEILPVRDTNSFNVYASDLAAKVPGSVQIDTFEEITEYVCAHAKSGDLLLTLGGGNVYRLANMIVEKLSQK